MVSSGGQNARRRNDSGHTLHVQMTHVFPTHVQPYYLPPPPQAAASFQGQVLCVDVAALFRGLDDSANIEAALASLAMPELDLRRTLIRAEKFRRQHEVDKAFVALRRLQELNDTLGRLEESGAFAPMRRAPEIRFLIGQSLRHQRLGPCVAYGWDHTCEAEFPRDSRGTSG